MMRVAPNKWSQFSPCELRALVQKHYPGFGSMQIQRLHPTDLVELLESHDKAQKALKNHLPPS